MVRPSRHGALSWAAGVAAAGVATFLVPAGAGAQLPGPPEACVTVQTADAAAGDLFACALAMDGDAAAVGSVLDDDLGSGSGSVYVFTRGGNGAWGQRAKILAADGAAGDQLGFAVGISGGRIAAGAPFRNQVGPRSGAVYLFEGGGAAWAQTAKLVPQGLGARDELGRSVAVAGAVVAAGAPGDDDRGSSAGAVYVFELGGATHKLTAADGAAGDGFGFAVALAGGTLLVGAPFADEGGAQAGAVYVFERQGSGWVQIAKLTAADRRPQSLFGSSVAVAGDRAAIGARLDDGAGANAGAAYVFARAGGAWSQQAKLLPPGLAAGEELGSSVALAGGAVVAGARFGAVAGLPGAGAAYIFELENGEWVARFRLVAATPGAGDELGFAVGIADGSVFAGAYRDDDGGTDAGTFCVFEGAGAGARADLAVTKSDGVTMVAPGGATTYTITAANAGPDAAAGARVTDDFPGALDCEWTCAGAGGGVCGAASGAGDIDQAVTLPAGGTVTFTAACAVSPNAAGTIANTAAVAAPAGVTDPDLGDNSATDVDTVSGAGFIDLTVSKSDGVAEVTCGGTTTYTIVARNVGTLPVAAARVRDDFPAALACAWTCTSSGGAACGAAAGAGDIDETVSLPVGGAATFTAACAVAPSAAGTIANTATVAVTSGGTDVNPGNDSATDTNTVVCPNQADLAVTKTDGVAEVTAGETTTYAITATNAGPLAVTGARVVDDFPAGLACQWSCTSLAGAACGAASGAGDIDQLVNLPAGGSVGFAALCTIDPALAGSELVNTATIAPPAGVADPDPSDNAATDTDTLVRVADLTLTKQADRTTVTPGGALAYTVTVVNAGPSAAAPVRVSDFFAAVLACAWECAATGGAACGTPAGAGDIDQPVTLPPGGEVTYAVTCQVAGSAAGAIENAAEATPPPGVTDPDLDDNTDTVTVTVVALANLSITKSDFVAQALAGLEIDYTLTVANAGPNDVVGARVLDAFPANLVGASWDCGGQFGTGDLDVTVDLPAGGSVVCTVSGVTPQTFCGPLENTASVAPPAGTDDPDSSDNQATDSTLIFPLPANGPPFIAPCASKGLLTGPHAPGSTVVYQVLLFNGGPQPILNGPADEFRDELPPQVVNPVVQADSGIALLVPPNLVTWNGDVAPGEVITLTITGTVNGMVGEQVINQGQFGDPQLGLLVPTDDPTTGAPLDPTVFIIAGVLEIPTLGAVALAALAALLAAAALRRLRRGRARQGGGGP